MGRTREIRSPYDGRPVGSVTDATPRDVAGAVARGRDVLRSAPLEAWQRVAILERTSRAIAAHRDELAAVMVREAAKPLTAARFEVERAVSTFAFAAAEARRLVGEMVPLDASQVGSGTIGFTLRVPVGVIAAISPFNFPLNLVAHKLAPAIAAGCPVVLKPADQTPLTALVLARLLAEDGGLPDGWLSVLPGGPGVGAALVADAGVALVSFTGSPAVGRAIREAVPHRKVLLELGNAAPVIVAPDADIDRAADAVAAGGYAYAGQSCISVQRVYVHASVELAFLERLTSRVEALRVGDPADSGTQVSALISESAAKRVEALIVQAVGLGGRVLVGGTRRASVVAPTLIAGLSPEMDLHRTEAFGPVVGVATFERLEEAIALANDTPYGLQAAVFSADLATALRATRELEFGSVLINTSPTWRADQMPYGGVRDSGNTREGPAYAIEEMTERRLIVLRP